ncbi:hypothetical protein INR49_026273 [Caranx melampygus]|nr:hypothetical protein INR49_026273 [Caranx melampygus]
MYLSSRTSHAISPPSSVPVNAKAEQIWGLCRIYNINSFSTDRHKVGWKVELYPVDLLTTFPLNQKNEVTVPRPATSGLQKHDPPQISPQVVSALKHSCLTMHLCLQIANGALVGGGVGGEGCPQMNGMVQLEPQGLNVNAVQGPSQESKRFPEIDMSRPSASLIRLNAGMEEQTTERSKVQSWQPPPLLPRFSRKSSQPPRRGNEIHVALVHRKVFRLCAICSSPIPDKILVSSVSIQPANLGSGSAQFGLHPSDSISIDVVKSQHLISSHMLSHRSLPNLSLPLGKQEAAEMCFLLEYIGVMWKYGRNMNRNISCTIEVQCSAEEWSPRPLKTQEEEGRKTKCVHETPSSLHSVGTMLALI